MKTRFLIYILFITILITACAGQPPPSPSIAEPTVISPPEELQTTMTQAPTVTQPIRRVQAITIPAPSLANNLRGEKPEREIYILLPPSYFTSEKRYPVIYYLDGWEETSIGVPPARIDRLINQGKIQDLIVVTVTGTNSLGNSFFVNSPINGDWEDFIVKDLLDYIDTNFRSIQDANSRAISGFDVGGYASLNLAMKYPDIFGSVYALDPSLFDPNGLAEFTLIFDREKPSVLAPIYGAAFSPDPNNKNYVQYPRTGNDGKLIRDEVWQRWQMGYGGPAAEIENYKENWQKLNGIGLSYSKLAADSYLEPFLKGAAYFVEQMQAAAIPLELKVNPMSYGSSLDTRILTEMLPFLSERLTPESQ